MEENGPKYNSVESGKTNYELPVVAPKGEKSFWVKLGAGSFILMSLTSAVGAALSSDYAQDPFHVVWFIAAVLWVTGTVTVIILRITGYKQTAVGMVIGLLIGLVALTASCVANLITYRGDLP